MKYYPAEKDYRNQILMFIETMIIDDYRNQLKPNDYRNQILMFSIKIVDVDF